MTTGKDVTWTEDMERKVQIGVEIMRRIDEAAKETSQTSEAEERDSRAQRMTRPTPGEKVSLECNPGEDFETAVRRVCREAWGKEVASIDGRLIRFVQEAQETRANDHPAVQSQRVRDSIGEKRRTELEDR